MNDGHKIPANSFIPGLGHDSYCYFRPCELPVSIDITPKLQNLFIQAGMEIGRFNYIGEKEYMKILIKKLVEKEALISSQIEGTQSTYDEIQMAKYTTKPSKDLQEVFNYFDALNHGVQLLKELPLCGRLFKEVHKVLLKNKVRGGENKYIIGEYRTTQNWVCGTMPSNAKYVPPAPDILNELMSNLEKYANDDAHDNVLMQAALLHYQFETIHPFTDGNGRTGRILIILFLIAKGLLKEPNLFISLYFKIYKEKYYEMLMKPRNTGKFEEYVEFFLEAIIYSIQQVVSTFDEVEKLLDKTKSICSKINRKNIMKVYDFILKQPIFNVKDCANYLNSNYQSTKNLIVELEKNGIISRRTEHDQQRNIIYQFTEYLSIISRGTEL